MRKVSKVLMSILLVFMLTFQVAEVPGLAVNITADAKVLTPSVKESKVTLYTGSVTYRIILNNVMKTAKVTYQSSNKNVAVVNATGVITPKKEGTANVVAVVRQNSKEYRLTTAVTVKKPYVGFIKSTNYLNAADTYSFKAQAYGIDDTIEWSVSDTSIAGISASGKLLALKPGKVFVYATAGEKTARCELTIGSNRLGTFAKDITINQDKTIWIAVNDRISNENLHVEYRNSKVIDCKWGKWVGQERALYIKVKGVGQDTLTISSDKSNDKLLINVTVTNKPKKLKKLTAQEIYEKCNTATVEISARNETMGALGSGFFISDNMVVTNYHVIEGANLLQVSTKDSNRYDVNKILGYSKELDMAILEVRTTKAVKHLELNQSGITVGETVYALGSPLGLTGTMTNGIISTASRIYGDEDFIQITAPISPGNSGGPLVNQYGEVVGINTMYYMDGQLLNFAINIKELQKINTNHPISVKDLYDLYEKERKANAINEDPTVSQNLNECQQVASGVQVNGTIKASEKGDLYWFYVSAPGWFEGIFKSNSLEDMKNSYFELYDIYGNYIATSFEQPDELYQYIDKYLVPGAYYIKAYAETGYTGSDMPYEFTLSYN